jgi:hypothetical protein
MKSFWFFVPFLIAFTGCGSNLGIHSLGNSTGDDKVVLTDATQRALTVINVNTEEKRKGAVGQDNNGGDRDGRRIKPSRVVCAEPSPDIAKAVQSALETSLKVKGEGKGVSGEIDAAITRTVTESIAQLGTRLATIQLLRDELSDLCRSYANGAVSSITYTLRLSRLDKKMITLLVSEASAGALSRALVTINGSVAGSGGGVAPEKLEAAEKKIEQAAKAATDASKNLEAALTKEQAATGDEAKDTARKEVVSAKEILQTKLNELTDRVLAKWALDTRGSGRLVASTASAIAGLSPAAMSTLDLKSIHKSYLEDDDVGTLLDACLTSLEDNISSSPNSERLQKIKDDLDKVDSDAIDAEGKFRLLKREMPSSPGDAIPEPLAHELAAKEMDIEKIHLKRQRLKNEYDEVAGAADKSGLLRYCRQEGMTKISSLIERKIKERASASQREFCASLASTQGVDEETKARCVEAAIHGF